MVVAVAIAADVNFGSFACADGVFNSLHDERVNDEGAGGGGGGADFSRQTGNCEARVTIYATVVDSEFGNVSEVFSAGMPCRPGAAVLEVGDGDHAQTKPATFECQVDGNGIAAGIGGDDENVAAGDWI